MALLGRLRHVTEGEYLVVPSHDFIADTELVRRFTDETDALAFLQGVVVHGDGVRQIGDLFYHTDIGAAREFTGPELLDSIASQLASDTIRLVPGDVYPGVVDIWLDEIARRHEAHTPGRVRRKPVVGTVIHTTRGAGVKGALDKVQRPGEPTWHFTIDRDGTIYQHVALNRTAGHAGKAELSVGAATISDVSGRTFGIELANLGALVKSTDARGRTKWNVWLPPKKGNPPSVGFEVTPPSAKPPFTPKESGTVTLNGRQEPAYYEPFPDAQIDALNRVLQGFRYAGMPEATNIVVGHEDVALPEGRKIDPGPIFPWDKLSIPR